MTLTTIILTALTWIALSALIGALLLPLTGPAASILAALTWNTTSIPFLIKLT